MLPDYANMKAVSEKMRYQQENMAAQAETAGGQATAGGVAQAWQPRRSLREEAEKQVGYHREQADKQDRAAAFFREHPEFDEFIQLIRSGVIGI